MFTNYLEIQIKEEDHDNPTHILNHYKNTLFFILDQNLKTISNKIEVCNCDVLWVKCM